MQKRHRKGLLCCFATLAGVTAVGSSRVHVRYSPCRKDTGKVCCDDFPDDHQGTSTAAQQHRLGLKPLTSWPARPAVAPTYTDGSTAQTLDHTETHSASAHSLKMPSVASSRGCRSGHSLFRHCTDIPGLPCSKLMPKAIMYPTKRLALAPGASRSMGMRDGWGNWGRPGILIEVI